MGKFEPSRDLLDLHGKVSIVTDGKYDSGQFLSRRGAKVYMAARNESKATAAIERLSEIAKDSKDVGDVVWLPFGLDDPREAKSAAELFLSKERRLDILVNNAGLLGGPCEVPAKGEIIKSMVVNHISPFVFVNILSPLLEQTAREAGSVVRIVNVASLAHTFVNHSDFSSLEGFNETYSSEHFSDLKRYGKSKLANIIWTKDLQQRFDAKNVPITCISLHPGNIHTEGVLEAFHQMPQVVGWLMRIVSRPFTVSPEEGAYTSLFAAASRDVHEQRDQFRGAYIVPYGTITTSSALSRDPELAKTLWQTTEQLLRDVYNM